MSYEGFPIVVVVVYSIYMVYYIFFKISLFHTS